MRLSSSAARSADRWASAPTPARPASNGSSAAREYEAAHGTGDFDGYWGIWDEPFIGFAGEVLATVPEPFFAALFTLSSHHPFVVPAAEAASLPDGYTKIHKGVAYVDRAFRRFFRAIFARRVVPSHDFRIRSRPCIVGEVRARDARVARQPPHHGLHPHPPTGRCRAR